MRRLLAPLLLLLAGLLVVALLWSEIVAAGWIHRSEVARPVTAPARLTAELERRARLRGLPGIERREAGAGRLVGVVEVFVADVGPSPLADVQVEALGVEGSNRVHRRATSGRGGRFAFDDLPALSGYALVVRHPPWREVVLRGLNVSRNRTTDAGSILLGAPTLLRGEVVDATGRPIAGAQVGLLRNRRQAGRVDLRAELRALESALDPLAEVWTDAGGAFSVPDVPPGRYVLSARAPGFATAFRDDVWVSLDERASAVQVVLDPGVGWWGRVLDAEGRPLPGARVIAVAVAGRSGGGPDRAETHSDSEGRYRLDSLIPGLRYFIEAWASGFAPRGRIAMLHDLTAMDLVLDAAGRVAGRITDAVSGEGIGGAEVFIVAGAANGITPLTCTADADGRYAFDLVGPGPVLLFGAEAPGRVAESFGFDPEHVHRVAPGETTVIDLALEGGVAAEGRVLDPRGRPVPYATVAFFDPRNRTEGGETSLTGTDGRWRVDGLRETTHEVRVQAAGFAPLLTDEDARVEIVAPGPWRQDFVLEAGAVLEGRVLDPDGAGVAGSRLRVTVTHERRRVRARVEDLVTVTDATGAWRLRGVPPRTELRVEARHDAWARAASLPLYLSPGEVRAVDLQLGPGVRIEGRVTAERGAAVEGARVRWGALEPGDERGARDAFRADQRLLARVVRTDADGRFQIDRLEPGRFLLKVEMEGYAPWYRRDLRILDEGSPTLRVELEPAAQVEGRVRDAGTGRGIEGAWVYAREIQPEADGEDVRIVDPGRVPALASAQTGRDGRYVIERLPPGQVYEIVAWLAPGFRAAVQARDAVEVRRAPVSPGAKGVDFALQAEDGSAAR